MILWKHTLFDQDSRSERQTYDDVASLQSSEDFHAKQGRSTGRCVLNTPTGNVAVYVKRYYQLPWWQRRFLPLDRFPGPLERQNLQRAQALGIRVPDPLLAGADPNQPCKSFLVIRALDGFAPLHQYLPSRYARESRSSDGRRSWAIFKRQLCREIVTICRRLHDADLYHRDLYLCHFFLRETPSASTPFDLALIDFGRLTQSRRHRWRVKDLAQLLFSADLPGITRADHIRFLKHYLHANPHVSSYQQFARPVLAKARLYHRHNARSAA